MAFRPASGAASCGLSPRNRACNGVKAISNRTSDLRQTNRGGSSKLGHLGLRSRPGSGPLRSIPPARWRPRCSRLPVRQFQSAAPGSGGAAIVAERWRRTRSTRHRIAGSGSTGVLFKIIVARESGVETCLGRGENECSHAQCFEFSREFV